MTRSRDGENCCSQWIGPDILVSVLELSGNENEYDGIECQNWTEIVNELELEYGSMKRVRTERSIRKTHYSHKASKVAGIIDVVGEGCHVNLSRIAKCASGFNVQ